MKDLFLKRKQAFRKECVGYLRYVLNDHFILFLLVLLGFLAYQYSQQNGTFYPFMNYYDGPGTSVEDNIANPTKVNNKQHQLLLTMGYKF